MTTDHNHEIPSPNPIPYVMRIGVTGHRNLDNPDGVTKAVDEILDHIRNTLKSATERPHGKCGAPKTWTHYLDSMLIRFAGIIWRTLPMSPRRITPDLQTPLEWLAISPLAKGADRIVAHCVLDREPSRLKAVLPFSIEEYSKDFKETDDLEEFEDLLKNDPDPIILNRGDGTATADDASPQEMSSEARDEGYLKVGQSVAEACEILIAVWDGEDARGTGGTAEVVQFAVDQGRTVVWINTRDLKQDPCLIVRHPGDETTPFQSGPLKGTICKPLPKTAKVLSENFHQMSAYNRDDAFDRKEYEAAYQRNEEDILNRAKEARLPENELSPALELLLPHYARADQLAIRYQKFYVWAAVAIYCLSAAAVSIVVIQVLFFKKSLWLILFELAAMLTAVILLRISKSESFHEKWLHDRHLAEQIRSSMFTSLLGERHQTARSKAEETLSFYRGPQSWVKDAFDRIIGSFPFSVPSPNIFPELKRFLIDAWIKHQAKWHWDNAQKKRKAAKLSQWAGLFFFAVTFLMASLHYWGVGHSEGEGHDPETSLLGNAITSLAIILPAWGAAVHAINVLRERDRIATRSEEMSKVLRKIAGRAEETRDLAGLRKVAFSVEEVMASENLEWLISLSFRELELSA